MSVHQHDKTWDTNLLNVYIRFEHPSFVTKVRYKLGTSVSNQK